MFSFKSGWARKSGIVLPNRPLSIHDPVPLGIDEYGTPIATTLVERSLIAGGEPGSGKSTAIQLTIAFTALCLDVTRFYFFDAKQVELGAWKHLATESIGVEIQKGIEVLSALQAEMNETYSHLLDSGLRKLPRGTAGYTVVVVDELAAYTSVYGDPKQQKAFSTLLRDVVSRGRAAGIVVIAATQRPSSDVVPTSLRDLFGYRWAFRCTTEASSDIILGEGWSRRGWNAAEISPDDSARGIGLLRAEGGVPRRVKAARLRDEEIDAIRDAALDLRGLARAA
jgi:S-DNA-T family DNA segregation ATPase FtsK/SpoIIIE